LSAYGKKAKTIGAAVGLFLLVALAICYVLIYGGGLEKRDNLAVHFIDVGQGDSILVVAGDRAMLVDGGRRDEGPIVAAYLKSRNISTIDVMVSTHPHADHIGGLLTVLKEFPVKLVVDSGIAHPSQTYESYLRLIDELNIPYKVAEAGQAIELAPGVQVEVLAPPHVKIEDSVNENSIVLKVTHGGVAFLLMGDAGFPEEKYLMSSSQSFKSDVLKVPHHGSRYSLSEAFLSRAKPEVSVIEVGPNKYGHPSPETLARLERAGSIIYRTDLNGNVVIATDGRSFTVTPQHETSSAEKLICSPTNTGMKCST